MKTKKLILFLTFAAVFGNASAQDVLYVSNLNDKAIKIIDVNPSTGACPGNFSEVGNINNPSAAIGRYGNYIFYLGYGESGEGVGEGKVNIRSIHINGTSHHNQGTYDLNGSSSSNLGFVRLAIDKNGKGWILAKKTSGDQMYLARFTANGSNGTISNFTVVSSNVTTSDNSNSVFENGDICFDGHGKMYALANNTNAVTKIYTMDPTVSTVLHYKWLLKTNTMTNFSGQVNGMAFTSTGSVYFSSTTGLWFLDQFTTNFAGTGTVKVSLIKSETGLTDLATTYWPMLTQLPVKITNIQTRLIISKGSN